MKCNAVLLSFRGTGNDFKGALASQEGVAGFKRDSIPSSQETSLENRSVCASYVSEMELAIPYIESAVHCGDFTVLREADAILHELLSGTPTEFWDPPLLMWMDDILLPVMGARSALDCHTEFLHRLVYDR